MSSDVTHNAKDDQLRRINISKVLSSEGPIVKCVVLRASPETCTTGGDKKPSAKSNNGNSERKILPDLIDEIEIDTTPSKSMVEKTLGGSFTFLGQYEDEGTVLMVRDIPEDAVALDSEELATEKMSKLQTMCQEREIDTSGMMEKSELINALVSDSQLPPINPHSLQPPLHNSLVRGDIVILKVAATEEDERAAEGCTQQEPKIDEPPNDDFFLNYTKSQYIAFASRTDIEETEVRTEEGNEGEQEEETGAQDEGEPYVVGQDEEIDDEDKSAMFNLVMNEVLRQYRDEHGRGPHTHELLELRATIAKELDVEISNIEIVDWNEKASRKSKNPGRRISFGDKDRIREYHPDPDEHLHPEDEGEIAANGTLAEDDEDYEPPTKKLKSASGDDGVKEAKVEAGGLNSITSEQRQIMGNGESSSLGTRIDEPE
eukprot:scaffold443_cov125-Cylindrotheca_fusiformis.AAC.14